MENQVPKILIVGCNKPIVETIGRLINNNGKWSSVMAFSVAEAVQLCKLQEMSLVLMGAGLSEEEEIQLKNDLAQLLPHLPVVKHYGGGSGLLFAEIYSALNFTT